MNRLFPRYIDKSLDDYQPSNTSQEQAVKTVNDYIANLRDHRLAGYGLTFVGDAGLGKTHLAQMVLKEAQAQSFTIESIELSSYIQLHHDKVMWSQQDDEYDNLEKVDRQIRRIRMKTDFVLLDDIGREHDGGMHWRSWSSRLLFDTLRYRSNRKLPVLLTTNLALGELDGRYTDGLVSLLHEVTKIIPMEGDDYREERTDRD